MTYDNAVRIAQAMANEENKPMSIVKRNGTNDFVIITDKLNIAMHYTFIETISPNTKEYLQAIVNYKIEDVIKDVRALPYYEINGQSNYFNASDVMDIILQLRKISSVTDEERVKKSQQAFEKKKEVAQNVLDIFENFLENKGVNIDNPERQQSGDGACQLYGTEYGDLLENIINLLND